MAEYNLYDVLGPIMVGPSSSHTAGACKIANAALKICGENFTKVEFLLHGSFAHTYKGHGTDKALVGGIMGFTPDDDNIQNAFEIAKEKGLNFEIKTTDLGEQYHPNTVKIIFHFENKASEFIIGSSIGGGAIAIVNINGIKIDFRGVFPTILLQYPEQKGIIAFVSSILTNNDYNIESINTKKDNIENMVTLTVEVEKALAKEIQEKILKNDKFIFAKYVEV